MTKSKKNLSKKSVTGFVLASLFALSTTLSTHATVDTGSQLANNSTIKPFINVVDSRDQSDVVIEFSDADVIAANAIAAQTADNTEYYMLAGEYQACVLSNSFLVDTDSSNAGILVKVLPSTHAEDSANHIATSNTNSLTQLALYNEDAVDGSGDGASKIRFILHVTPAGMTQMTDSFGNSGSTTGSFSQLPAASFLIGADAASGAQAAVYLHDNSATGPTSSATNLYNLELSSWGVVNHFGTNSDLGAEGSGAQSETDDTTLTRTGLQTGEAVGLTGCTVDQDPSAAGSTGTFGLITYKIYVNVNDLAGSVAGTYSTQYQHQYGDADDVLNSAANDIS